MNTIYLTGDYKYNQYTGSHLALGTVIDAYGATFIQDNDKTDDGKANPYPVAIRDSADLTLRGGTVLGNVDQTKDRDIIYHTDPGNSAAVRAEDSSNIIIQNWRIDNAWDGVRVSTNTENFLIEDVWITDARDDAIENDKLNSGTIRDCLFDGVMNGISLDPSSSSPVDGRDRDVTIDGVVMRMKTYLSEGEVTHGSLIKMDKDLPMPDLHITNSVFAIEDVSHNGVERLAIAWSKVVESRGNVFLNLSDTALPKDYPLPPSGWTVLQGQAARDYWSSARDQWVADHANTVPHLVSDDMGSLPVDPTPSDPDPTPTEPDPTPVDPTPVKQSPVVLVGDAGANALVGGGGHDTLFGCDGDDRLDGATGADRMVGGAGSDVYHVDNTGDQVIERAADKGTDLVISSISFATRDQHIENITLIGTARCAIGNELDNLLMGNEGANALVGYAGDDTLFGGGGSDRLNGGTGADRMVGGAGSDIYHVDNTGDQVFEAAGVGTDLVISSISFATRDQHIENITLIGNANIDAVGNGLNNFLVGNAGANVLIGDAGNDTLFGGGGNDTLNGATGADRMTGGAGSDIFHVDDTGDQVFERAADAGTDLVISSISFTTRGQHIENITLIGTARCAIGNELDNLLMGNEDDNALVGYAGKDTLFGGGGNDRLNGGTGADRMDGGAGSDIYHVDNTGDQVFEAAGVGTDLVISSISFATRDQHIENITLIGNANINAVGNGLSNVLTGNAGANVLVGDAGNDTLIGGSGNDTLNGGADDDLLIGGAGADDYVFTGTWGNDRIRGFEDGIDHLDMPGVARFQDLTLSHTGGGVLVGFGGNTVFVEGVSSLDHADFDLG